MSFSVLIVEDDPMVAMINEQYVLKNKQFSIAGSCRNGQEALDFLAENKADLIVLDVFMPYMDGIETLKKIREKKINSEVIMVTAANDTATLEETMHLGVIDYLIKPFAFERFQIALQKFASKVSALKENDVLDQDFVDSIISSGGKHGEAVPVNAGAGGASNLPKGIQKHTLEMILDYFKENTNWTTGDSVAEKTGVSIVTVRHYMNYLVQTGKIEEDINYETGGRPSMMYKKI
ncbi:response regulator [Treponema sp. Marseille-Q3903]|uniref:response regulator n=1 Tax=Treponema sp. Marseille-Q3903 TaxID=2766703 RepID=UPI001651F939|nr:response regulator [Treponema sp. Marseille-Q3903]MBC6714303.1 response regulator [Treponema sp. Marseille-Q3903]